MEHESVTDKVIGAAIEVHRATGPGLLESAYEVCLAYQLTSLGLDVQRQVALPVVYKEVKLDAGYRLDLLVNDCVVVEVKAVETLLPIHQAQLITYLKLSGHHVGLLLNFNVPMMRDGIKRVVMTS